MPLDGLTLGFMARELHAALCGARIERVNQPEKDMLVLLLRNNGKNHKLILSASPSFARAHLTDGQFTNPLNAPMFCMLMRKHLTGARVLSVRQPDFERMLILDLETRDELGISARKQLVVEMIGRSSNVILVGPDGRIIDCMRRVDFAGDALRRLLPGMIYRLPPRQEKPAFFALTPEERAALVQGADREQPMDKWLLASFAGLSPLVCRELAFRCGGDWERLPFQLEALAETVSAGELAPMLLTQEGKALDFSFMAVSQYGAAVQLEHAESFSRLLDDFYSRRDRAEQQRRRGHELRRSVKTARDRLARKLANQQEEFKRTEEREAVRRFGIGFLRLK